METCKFGAEVVLQIPDVHTGWVIRDGRKYFYNSKGELMTNRPAKLVIDISEHNNDIEWNMVKTQGNIDGVILRLSYDFVENDPCAQIDEKFINNYQKCKRLEIPVGIYLYSYRVSEYDAIGEVNRVLELLGLLGIKPSDISMPIYYDLEEYGDNKIPLTLMAQTFCNIIEKAGFNAGVYASTNYYLNYIDYNEIEKFSIWVAQYNDYCTYNTAYDVWQYSSVGRISGINANVDMNILF